MGWEWIPTIVNTVFSVLEVAAVAGVGVACPPLAPVVGGCLAIGGNLVGQAVTKAVEGDQALGYAQGIYGEQLQDLRNELNNNGWLLEENKEMLKDIKGMILSTAEENREMMRDMKKSLIKFEENVNKNFDDLKDFMIEKDFIQADYYHDNKPKEVFEEFLVKLKHTHTNPISSAMEKNVYLSKHIRTHYTQLLSEMVVKVIAIEGFHQVLTIANKTGSTKYKKDFSAHMESMIAQLTNFFINYELPKDKYWPKLVQDAVYENNNDDKLKNIADRIKENLTGIHTRDIFTIHVFNCPQEKCIVYDPLPDSVVQREESPLMIKDINEETSVYAIVLRSENYRSINESDKVRLDTAYLAHYLWSPNWEGDKCDGDTWGNLGKAFKYIFNDEKIRPHGFVACGVPGKIEQRLTNDTATIFTEKQQSTMDNLFYFGLSWP